MFHTYLRLNPKWREFMGGTYHLHCRLSMMFPTHERVRRDPNFIESFIPEQFTGGAVHVRRNERDNFLFREQNNFVIVQSGIKPDAEYAFKNFRQLLDGEAKTEEFRPAYKEKSSFTFNVRLNPTFHRNDDKRTKEAITSEKAQREWFARKAEKCGFRVCDDFEVRQEGLVRQRKSPRTDLVFSHYAIQVSGVGVVTDPELFSKAVVSGIGSGKAFGFGLMLAKFKLGGLAG